MPGARFRVGTMKCWLGTQGPAVLKRLGMVRLLAIGIIW